MRCRQPKGARRFRWLPLAAGVVVIAASAQAIPGSRPFKAQGRALLAALAPWWSQEARADEEMEGVIKTQRLFTSPEEAKAAAERLKATGAGTDLLEQPVDLRPPEIPQDDTPSEMVRDLVREVVEAAGRGDIGAAGSALTDLAGEAQAAAEADGIPWEQIAPIFFAFVFLANSAAFVYPLLEEALEEDDLDRLPMPSGTARQPRAVVEEVDLKLPPKTMSERVKEEAAKKAEKAEKAEKKDWKKEEEEESKRSA
ncbi:unnamed protein product [Effrenium voratum]|nr:unnamed protein product [Effrenium voratum]CAJ1419319.1 unnamed protein product [Effrenium voratum]